MELTPLERELITEGLHCLSLKIRRDSMSLKDKIKKSDIAVKRTLIIILIDRFNEEALKP